jgi:serine/threonine-protein kinase
MEDYADPREFAESRVGAVLRGRWRLVRLIAMGGSAWVYVAADGKGGPPAAVKVLHRALVNYPEIVHRFRREAQVARAIEHRAVVRVLDEGRTEDDVPFFAMELLDGETLEERRIRKGGRLPVAEVLWAMDEVLGALAAAHRKNILHRDIKPENVFLTNTHAIKLLDFGIARVDHQAVDADEPDEVTRMGMVMGSIDFMAPEQGRGDWTSVGVPTDLWAVGATMFVLLVGHPVHDEMDLTSQMAAVVDRSAPPMAEVAPDLPPAVQFLVDEALRFDASQRWSDAGSMRIALRLAYRAMKDDAPPDSGGDVNPDSVPRIPRPPLYFAPSIPPLSRRRGTEG